ncbi:MAG: hypothetical protein CBD88_01225 [Flavobacteriales bacterium TMED228]|nr:MAG: hypothetical protein CBD88_01225 [Flavobacteriales bacterium TMED228]
MPTSKTCRLHRRKTMNPLKGETQITLGSEDYTCRLTIDSLMKIEDEIGMGIIKLVSKLSTEMDMPIKHQLSILYHALRGGGNDLTQKQVKQLVTENGLIKTTQVILVMLTSTLNDEDDGEKKEEGAA